MSIPSTAALIEVLQRRELLEPAQLQEAAASLRARYHTPQTLVQDLLGRGWLTPYQAEELLAGRGDRLVLGQYVLVDKLGEGGMGQVFKARHPVMNRVVALKVIRGECLAHPDAVNRFRREIQAAARLLHPNIVVAFDAAQAGDTHFLVMEYVEGTSLAGLLGKQGRLPVGRACDYVRQAALGLQHAHERGLVHRDVKPANLLLTADGRQVKVADLGLARLTQRPQDAAATPLTQANATMGTLDYMAPEQAVDAATADIRADVYSLGCTLSHLLTGQVPFPGGSAMQKLIWHQQARPAPVRELRPDAPPALSDAVARMMAKRPEDRPQTPAAVAQSLEPFCTEGPPPASATDVIGGSTVRPREPEPLSATLPYPESKPPARRSRWLLAGRRSWLAASGSALMLVLLLFTAPWLFQSRTERFSNVGSGLTMSAPPALPEEPAPGPHEVLSAIADDLQQTPEADRSQRRYLTLTHLLHRGAAGPGIDAYRESLSPLGDYLGGLAKRPVKVHPIDGRRSVYAIDLRALGFRPEEDNWRRLLRVYPYGLAHDDAEEERLREPFRRVLVLSGSPLPYVRGDWFLANARQLLVLPDGARAGDNLLLPQLPDALRAQAEAYERQELDLRAVAADLGLPGTERLEQFLRDKEQEKIVRNYGLTPLSQSGSIRRSTWEEVKSVRSAFQAVSAELGLGTPYKLP